ncbi:MAG: ABC transporter substrate-binding protein [Xanthobacteraceae bacterium]|nr:ABC transporter substrate-binding protein [Xanthobacteraceae bacterium]MBV9630695.1 ABC transporter substrate-binding protein [Xanthobacteraceae bacterium]
MVMSVIRRMSSALVAVLALLATSLPTLAQEKIRLGLIPISEALGAVIADREGFFKAEGLAVDITKFESGATAVPVLQSGRLDVALSNTVSTLQAIGQGLDAVVLAPGAVVRSAPPDTTTALIALKDNIKSIKDLEGKRIAVNVINSSAWLHAVAALDQHGVDWHKVRFVEVPFPQMNDPLLNGQVDAVVQVDPFRSALMATGKAEILSWTYVETAPGTDITQYIALGPWAQKNHDTAVKFARAVMKGSQFAGTNEAATRDINLAWTGLNPAFKDKVLLPQLGTSVNIAAMAKTMELMQKFGLLKEPIDISKRVLAVP